MGYTHGTSADAEFRICTECGRKLPNTEQYYSWYKSRNNYASKCRECNSRINKEKRLKKIEVNKNQPLFYEGTKKCICCGRDLPNNKLYFPIDLSCVSGLRNKCRECDLKNGRFLEEDYTVSEKWSEEDLKVLKENYKDYTNRELQEKFFPNRTIRSIECEANVMGWGGKTDETFKRSRISQASIVRDKLTGRLISDEWREKISKAKKEYYKTHDGWWKGKKRSSEQCKQISERQKGKWAGDKNPRHLNPLNGENNGRWKGGINNTYFELRSDTKDWQQQSMKFCNYKCVITGGRFHNIHHTTAFRNIVDEIFEITNINVKPQVKDYSKEEFNLLRSCCIELHNIYGYGACINERVHKLFHDTYGYIDFSPYDFLEFVKDISWGKYDKWFEDNGLNININYDYINYLESTLVELESA